MSMGDRLVVLKDGLVQQIGTPLEIYERPVNQFVAGFIGSPPMNFFNCLLVQREAQLYLSADGFDVNLPVENEALLFVRNGVNHKVVLGIRAEDIFEQHAFDREINGN